MSTPVVSQFDIFSVAPVAALALGAFLVLIVEVFSPARWPRATLSCASLMLSAALCLKFAPFMNSQQTVFSGLVYADHFGMFFTFLIILGTTVALLLGESRVKAEGIEAPGEYYSLMLMASAGAIVFVNASEFITFFLGLEIMSMALYSLCGSSLGSERSAESAMKYFLLGSFSSAFLLYGIAIVYGLTGSMQFAAVANELSGQTGGLFYTAMALIIFGLCFKIGLVPFHFWAPDVYQGAPTSVTAYMACVVKAAAVGAAMRVLWVVFGDFISVWSGAVWLIAVMTMLIGNLIALRQRSLKRMLAYSSVAHAGYILMAFLAPGNVSGGAAAILFYLVAYTVMTMGAFGIVMAVSDGQKDSDDITVLNGFGVKNPMLAALMALFMLSLAGIPPGLAGMLGKFYVFNATIKAGYVGLAVIGVLSACISCYYYLRVIVAMYFIESDGESAAIATPASLVFALFLCAFAVVLLGVFPSYLYDGTAFVSWNF